MEKNIPFFKKIIISIKDLDKYNLLIAEKMRRSIIYLLEIMIIFTLILSAIMTYKTNELINKSLNYIVQNVPDFTIDSEGLKLNSEENYTLDAIKDLGIKIILDDKAEEINAYQEEIDNFDGSLIVALKNKVVIISEGNKMEFQYENLLNTNEISNISKDGIISAFEDNKVQINIAIFMSMFGMNYLIYTISVFIDALALSLLVIIISKMAKIPLKYSQALIIAISSLTLPIILNLVYSSANLLNNFYMPYFQIMYALISYIYIVAVILIMRSDLIKKKQLIKATIEVKELEKNLENRDEKNKDDSDEKDKDEDDSDENKDKKLDDVKRKVKGKDNPEPQANIEGGK